MGAVSTNKRSNAGKNVLVFFIVFIILEMLIVFGIGKVFKNKDVTPSIAGYSIYMTNRELTEKTEDGGLKVVVPKNVLVIASNGMTDAVGKIGSAVLCERVDGAGTGVFWLADVNSKDGEDGAIYTIANGNSYYTAKSSNIVGITGSYFTTAGKVISFVTSKFGMIVCAVVPLFFLVLIELIIAIATHSPEEEEEDEEEDDEPEKEVKLDDFLFGGQNEGEQIAKRRHQQVGQDNAAEEGRSGSDDDELDLRRESKPAPKLDLEFSQINKEPVSSDSTLSLKDDTNMSEYYDKASRLIEDAPAEKKAPAKPVKRPAQQRRPRPQAKRSAPAIGNASLEDLMKLMEEEQNKLKKQVK
ncbi:MAG: hypothetical protein J5994_03995 [Ruminococcus sp.]|nr:hypothetical protein [Ruminococcus sp.]